MSRAKTEGYEWLQHSLISFNGSGYADMSSAQAFVNSYKAYKLMKRDMRALNILEQHSMDALAPAFDLVTVSVGAGRKPSAKALTKFAYYYPPANHYK